MATAVAELIDREVKRDEQGRRITPAARRAELVAAYRSSGLTMVQFARREGINRFTLAKWATQLGGKRSVGPVRFEEIKMGLRAAWVCEAVLPNGMIVRAASVAALAELLGLVRG
jgi:transposase-like protein